MGLFGVVWRAERILLATCVMGAAVSLSFSLKKKMFFLFPFPSSFSINPHEACDRGKEHRWLTSHSYNLFVYLFDRVAEPPSLPIGWEGAEVELRVPVPGPPRQLHVLLRALAHAPRLVTVELLRSKDLVGAEKGWVVRALRVSGWDRQAVAESRASSRSSSSSSSSSSSKDADAP